MNSSKTLTLVGKVYDTLHLALWAIAAVFVCYFVAVIAPRLPQAHARAEGLRAMQNAAEDESYCAKWQMGPATAMHHQCVLDLEEFRAKVEQRLAADNDF